jgi:hypothetical protein
MYALYRPPPFDINLPDHSFGELALLFPNTDIDIVMFGSSAYNVTRQARPSAIAAQKYAYEFRAPEQCGSGSIRIQLYKESAIWDPIDILPRKMIPDALIGLNAGMSTFATWRPRHLSKEQQRLVPSSTSLSRFSSARHSPHDASLEFSGEWPTGAPRHPVFPRPRRKLPTAPTAPAPRLNLRQD